MKKIIIMPVMILSVILLAGCGQQQNKQSQQTLPNEDANVNATQDNACSADSDCRFACGCGCIKTGSKCDKEGTTLCNMPSGSCKCNNKKCDFEAESPKNKMVCCESFGFGARMVKCCEKYEWTTPEACKVPQNFVGGGKQIVDNSFCK